MNGEWTSDQHFEEIRQFEKELLAELDKRIEALSEKGRSQFLVKITDRDKSIAKLDAIYDKSRDSNGFLPDKIEKVREERNLKLASGAWTDAVAVGNRLAASGKVQPGFGDDIKRAEALSVKADRSYDELSVITLDEYSAAKKEQGAPGYRPAFASAASSGAANGAFEELETLKRGPLPPQLRVLEPGNRKITQEQMGQAFEDALKKGGTTPPAATTPSTGATPPAGNTPPAVGKGHNPDKAAAFLQAARRPASDGPATVRKR